MSGPSGDRSTADQQEPKKLIRSQYKDVMVKIDEDVYYLDRLQLALKSGYFEKLFIGDFSDKNCESVEIPVMDSDTFSAVVDIIYGRPLKYVIDIDNYVSLLMSMDYLQMEINGEKFEKLVCEHLCYSSAPQNNVLKLYNFIAENATYEYLLPVVFNNLSEQLENVCDLDEFLLIPFDHFIKIISHRHHSDNMVKFAFSKICAKWICYNVESRLPRTVDLVNAAMYRFYLPNKILREDFEIQLSDIDDHAKQDIISRYFWQLLMYNGKICCFDADSSASSPLSASKSDDDEERESHECSDGRFSPESESAQYRFIFDCGPKLETFLRNSNLYDITVQAGEKMYKLHRSVLKSESSYFEEIFSIEYSEVIAQCEGIPTLPNKDKVYFINGIDSAVFDIIIDYIYLREEKFTHDVIVRLFKAAHFLKTERLLCSCKHWMKTHSEVFCLEDVIEILNFTHENVEHNALNRFFISKYIVDSWPKVDNLPQFADLFKAISLPKEAGDPDENKVYLFDKVDQDTFGQIINYVYFGELKEKFEQDNIVRILKASEVFKMEKLMKECVNWLNERRRRLSSRDVFEVLSFAQRNIVYDVLNRLYLAEYITKEWPEIDDSLLGGLSHYWLEYMLISPEFHFDDLRTILDICSKWVIQDTENRYCLIPKIALAISRNRMVDCNQFSIENPTDLEHCSQAFVGDKILEVLSSTSILPSAMLSENETKKTESEQPVFITSTKDRKFRILNADWGEIASFYLGEYVYHMDSSFYVTPYTMSATMIKDNLFILCTISNKTLFHVYNFSSKNLFSLASDSRIDKRNKKYICRNFEYTLLSCCNEIYCCIEDGEILKYSFEFNRWSKVSDSEPDKDGMCFTSDGNMLYRVYKTSETDTTTSYAVESYSFELNSWISSPNVPAFNRSYAAYEDSKKENKIGKLIFLKNYGFAVLFKQKKLFLFDQQAQRWRNMRSLPYDRVDVIEEHSIIGQDAADEMLYVSNNKLYSFSSTDRDWELKKEWPLMKYESALSGRNCLTYGNIIAIHKTTISS